MKFNYKYYFMFPLLACSCGAPVKENKAAVRLVTLDPGHFHAALVQKSMYEDIDPTVYVYAPEGPEVQQHLAKIEGYNNAQVNPTHWKEDVYKGNDFLDKMLAEKKGNVVVISGNNRRKIEYIEKAIDGGFNVLADKPMVIDPDHFNVLKNTFETAKQKKLLLYDIMTERYEITNTLQRELVSMPDVFGTLQKGTLQNPAIQMESIHYFYKEVSGSILTRPSWFMDISQQGEAIADVAVHLVDLVQWECFPDKIIDYQKDIQLNSASRWTTDLSFDQFAAVTQLKEFPGFLKKNISNKVLKVFANGEINYKLNGVCVKVRALWDYKARKGGDAQFSQIMGTRAKLIIRQGEEQDYKPTLYIEPIDANINAYGQQLEKNWGTIQVKFPGITLKRVAKGWEVIIPQQYKVGHEAHFAQVTAHFLEYLKKGNIPAWEVPNMLAKYYTTIQALALAKNNKTDDLPSNK